jgi:hypothetical protein
VADEATFGVGIARSAAAAIVSGAMAGETRWRRIGGTMRISLAARLAQGFSDAADHEPDAERKIKLRQLADFIDNAEKDVAAEVLAKVILRSAGMG